MNVGVYVIDSLTLCQYSEFPLSAIRVRYSESKADDFSATSSFIY